MFQKKSMALFSISVLTAFTINAAPLSSSHMVIAPSCLIKHTQAHYQTLSSTADFSLIKLNDAGINELIKTKTMYQASGCGGFMDVTQEWEMAHTKKSTPIKPNSFLLQQLTPAKTIPVKTNYSIQYPEQVNNLLKQINPQALWNDLTSLTNFQDRYANSSNGVQAANWLKTQIETLAKNYHRDDVTVTMVATGTQYKQPSVVVKIGKNSSEPGVVIGGHMDTLNGSFSKKPGADDDGSGTVTVLEVARTILASGMQFKKPLYFIWYAAEEEGLVGSGYVVAKFKKDNIPVSAVLHLDMTGYAYKNEPTMWLMTDYVNKDLTAYLETLINAYVKQPVKYSKCGYACSDHASWNKAGYAAAIPFESAMNTYNPAIHSSQDTMDKLSLNHMTDYAKLAIAFAVELAEPVI